MKKFTGNECSSWILDTWLLLEPQTVHTKWKKKSEIRTGRWGGG